MISRGPARHGTGLLLVLAVLSWSQLAGVGAGPSHPQCHLEAAHGLNHSACCPLHSRLQTNCSASTCCEMQRQPVPAVDRDRMAPRALRDTAAMPAQAAFADLRPMPFPAASRDFVRCYSPPVLAQKEDLRI